MGKRRAVKLSEMVVGGVCPFSNGYHIIILDRISQDFIDYHHNVLILEEIRVRWICKSAGYRCCGFGWDLRISRSIFSIAIVTGGKDYSSP